MVTSSPKIWAPLSWCWVVVGKLTLFPLYLVGPRGGSHHGNMSDSDVCHPPPGIRSWRQVFFNPYIYTYICTAEIYRGFSMGLWAHSDAGVIEGAWVPNPCLEERRATCQSETSIWPLHVWLVDFYCVTPLRFGGLSVIAACITVLTNKPGKSPHLRHHSPVLPSFGFWYFFHGCNLEDLLPCLSLLARIIGIKCSTMQDLGLIIFLNHL